MLTRQVIEPGSSVYVGSVHAQYMNDSINTQQSCGRLCMIYIHPEVQLLGRWEMPFRQP